MTEDLKIVNTNVLLIPAGITIYKTKYKKIPYACVTPLACSIFTITKVRIHLIKWDYCVCGLCVFLQWVLSLYYKLEHNQYRAQISYFNGIKTNLLRSNYLRAYCIIRIWYYNFDIMKIVFNIYRSIITAKTSVNNWNKERKKI